MYILSLQDKRNQKAVCICPPDGRQARRGSDIGVALLINLSSGVVAGTLASLLTHPFDVIKTRVMAAEHSLSAPPQQGGTYAALRDLVAREGPGAVWRGLVRSGGGQGRARRAQGGADAGGAGRGRSSLSGSARSIHSLREQTEKQAAKLTQHQTEQQQGAGLQGRSFTEAAGVEQGVGRRRGGQARGRTAAGVGAASEHVPHPP